MASTKDSTTLNEAQTNFLALLMRNIKSKPDIDPPFLQKFDAVANELGITPKSTKERFRLLSIKMGWKDGPSTPMKPTGVTKRTPAKRGSAKKGGKGNKEPATPGADDDSDVEPKKDDDSDENVKGEAEG